MLGDYSKGRYSGNLLQLVVVMCLLLSMVVWQPFCACRRYIITRVSEMHVAYHKVKMGCGIFTSLEQTTIKISNNFAIPLLLSFLTCIVECVCEGGRGGGGGGGGISSAIEDVC